MGDNMYGIEELKGPAGRPRYRVRMRRQGQEYNARYDKLADAIRYRDGVLDALAGHGEMPPAPAVVAPPGRAVTVEDAARRLCRGMKDGTLRSRDGTPYKPGMVRKYEAALRLLVLPEVGSVPVPTLSHGDVQRLVDGIAAARTPEHARQGLTALRVALRVAVRYGEIDANPCAGVRVPTNPDGEAPPRILTPEEAAAIVAQAEADDVRLGRSFAAPMVALALGTGLRLGELLALSWGPDGLDLAAGMVRVRRSLDRVRGEDGDYAIHAPKSRASRRDVPLAPEDLARMRVHLLATGRPDDGELVFGGSDGEALSPVPAGRGFKRACFRAKVFTDAADDKLRAEPSYDSFRRACAERKLEMPLPRFHDLRHSFATHALAAGLTAHAVAALLGHSDTGLVWRRYGHALPTEIARAGDALSAWRAARTG